MNTLLKIYVAERVEVDPDTGCWEWQLGKNEKGYGIASVAGKCRLAHRVSMSAFRGFDLDSSINVLHHCDNPRCVNPGHLFLGTPLDNARDRVRKGRGMSPRLSGEKHWNARLTKEDVSRIRDMYKTGGVRQRDLASQFGVSRTTVSKIVNGQRWVEVTTR